MSISSAPGGHVKTAPPPGELDGTTIHLIVEVAGGSLRRDLGEQRDLGEKARLRAGHGIAAYRVIGAAGERLTLHRQPQRDGYADIRSKCISQPVSALIAPDIKTIIADIMR